MPKEKELREENWQFLQKADLLQGLSAAELLQVSEAGRQVSFEPDAFLYFQGDPAERLHILVSGRARLSQLTPEGQQVILRYAGPGEAIAVVAVLSEMQYPTSATAVEKTIALVWDRKTMQDLMLQMPRIALNALNVLSRHTREFQDRIRELSTERVERRIARALLRLTRQAGRRVEEGVLLDMSLSRQDLAEMSGTTLYTVSRTLTSWESQGIIKAGRERVVILFPHGLVTIAEDLPETNSSQ